MPVALICPEALRDQDGPHVELLQEAGFEIRYPKNPFFTRGHGGEPETIDELQGCSAVLAGGEFFGAAALRALPQLRVIARAGVGYDRVDVAAATRQGVVVTITPTANHESVAEHALALILATAKSIVFGDQQTKAGQWPIFQTQPIRGTTLGLLGLGRIGKSLAIRAAAMGMQLLVHEPFPDKSFVREHQLEVVDFNTLLAQSDYLSIHCPLTEKTRGMFDAATMAKMKKGSVLINTARGPLVQESDLVAALQSGHLRGAGLDVFAEEPPAKDNPLFQLPQVVVSPHNASQDWLSLQNMAVEAATCIARLYQGDWPETAVVNKELPGKWAWRQA